MRNHLLASEGYCVVSIDSRGSHNRGTAFEAHLRHRMGQVSIRINTSFTVANIIKKIFNYSAFNIFQLDFHFR